MGEKKKVPEQRSVAMEPEHTIYVKIPGELRMQGDVTSNYLLFKQKFDLYIKATRQEKLPTENKSVLFLNFIGDAALQVYNNFVFERESDKTNLQKIIEKFDAYIYCQKRT